MDKEIKEFYRLSGDNYFNDIIINENTTKVMLTEIGLNRFVNKHIKDGFIVISPNRGENTPQENNRLTQQLKSDITKSGYSFIPVEGGYKETVKDENGNETFDNDSNPITVDITEKSFIVPITKKDNSKNPDELYRVGLELCQKYKQQEFLFSNGEKFNYIDDKGNVTMSFNRLSLNNAMETYYTRLKKGNASTSKVDRRFTYTESVKTLFEWKSPTYSTNHRRYAENEIQLWL